MGELGQEEGRIVSKGHRNSSHARDSGVGDGGVGCRSAREEWEEEAEEVTS